MKWGPVYWTCSSDWQNPRSGEKITSRISTVDDQDCDGILKCFLIRQAAIMLTILEQDVTCRPFIWQQRSLFLSFRRHTSSPGIFEPLHGTVSFAEHSLVNITTMFDWLQRKPEAFSGNLTLWICLRKLQWYGSYFILVFVYLYEYHNQQVHNYLIKVYVTTVFLCISWL
jgi:hypothetical protein